MFQRCLGYVFNVNCWKEKNEKRLTSFHFQCLIECDKDFSQDWTEKKYQNAFFETGFLIRKCNKKMT
jgi:hypothetical protein